MKNKNKAKKTLIEKVQLRFNYNLRKRLQSDWRSPLEVRKCEAAFENTKNRMALDSQRDSQLAF